MIFVWRYTIQTYVLIGYDLQCGYKVITMTHTRNISGLQPFTKDDPRINRKGKPPAFDALRAAAQKVLAEPARDKKGQLITDKEGTALSNLDVLLRRWVASDDPRLQVHVVEVAYGKVPNPVTLTDKDGNAQPLTMIEVVKDHGDGNTETLRAMTSSPAVSDSLHRQLDASIRADADAHPPTIEHASMSTTMQDIAS